MLELEHTSDRSLTAAVLTQTIFDEASRHNVANEHAKRAVLETYLEVREEL